jgi:hypothetical protein
LTIEFLRKYPNLPAAIARPEPELAADFEAVVRVIETHPDRSEAFRLTVVRDWIGQQRRMRIPGVGFIG